MRSVGLDTKIETEIVKHSLENKPVYYTVTVPLEAMWKLGIPTERYDCSPRSITWTLKGDTVVVEKTRHE